MNILESLKGKVIVSSQAMPDEPLYKEECMLAMMASCVNGGAGGLRVAGARDVRNAKSFGVPVIGGIIIGVVAVACLTALMTSKETEEEDKTLPQKDVKQIEKSEAKQIKKVAPQKNEQKIKDNKIKSDLYKGVPDSLLPLSAISEIASLNGNLHKTIKELVDNSTGVLYAKRNGNKLLMVVENPDDNRHGLEFIEISADGKHEKIGFLLSKYSEGNTDDDLWEYETEEEVKRPVKHTKFNSDGEVEFVETWNYSSDEPIKYELKNNS